MLAKRNAARHESPNPSKTTQCDKHTRDRKTVSTPLAPPAFMRRAAVVGLGLLLCTAPALAQDTARAGAGKPSGLKSLYKRFDVKLSSQDQRRWLKRMSSEPNQVGSPHDKANAMWELRQFRKFGWDAHIEKFHVLYPTPIEEAVQMGDFQATLQERPIPDDTSFTARQRALPAYLAYQGDGDVSAPLVYVNYGTQADYKQLKRRGVSVKGKIVIARYGRVWRGVKPLLAEKHGAIGCIIYSDPADDGYGEGATYPIGPMRPPQGIQRGSVMDMMLYPGDPLTPGEGATKNAQRLKRKNARSIVDIPALPISYADAKVLLSAMSGPVAPPNWRGGLGMTYRIGPGTKPVHLKIQSDWGLKTVYDVIATIKGSRWPNQWVVRGNHHDGWVEGATDPLSGQVALLDEAKSLGKLHKNGWQPKRTIVYASWDGEEPMLLGSTEWAEQHAAELKKKAVIYINTDGNVRGYLHASGNQDLGKYVTRIADSVTDPEAHVTVGKRSRDHLLTEATERNASDKMKAKAKRAAKQGSHFPVSALGSGSDYSSFIDHLGVTTLAISYGGEAKGGAYHSRYDTFEHHTRFEDPGMVYGEVLSKTIGHAVLYAADTGLPLQDPTDFAGAAKRFVHKVKKLAKSRRKAAHMQNTALHNNAYAIAADPTKPHGLPVPRKQVPKFDFSPLEHAVAALKKQAKAYDSALSSYGGNLSAAQSAKLQHLMGTIDQTLLSSEGLPRRPWYKNLIYAPGRYKGYGVTTLPAVTEAITEERWSDVPQYIRLTAKALQSYSARLGKATKVLKQGHSKT